MCEANNGEGKLSDTHTPNAEPHTHILNTQNEQR